jgi:ABC-2 type transport system ATP-binding protein
MLQAVKLSKRFGDRYALQALDLTIGPGEIQCLLGANGAGKTTTINLFLGFLQPSSGAAYVNGREVGADARVIREQVAYVPEQVNLYPSLTGMENLVYFARLAQGPIVQEKRLQSLLDQVGLLHPAAETRVLHYSKGMRQKVGLAIALAKGARALLLDEPLSGLDPQAANEFCTLLRQLAERGTAVLMVTHDLFRAKEVGDRVGIMKAGRLVENREAARLTHSELERVYLDHMRTRDIEPEHSL